MSFFYTIIIKNALENIEYYQIMPFQWGINLREKDLTHFKKYLSSNTLPENFTVWRGDLDGVIYLDYLNTRVMIPYNTDIVGFMISSLYMAEGCPHKMVELLKQEKEAFQ